MQETLNHAYRAANKRLFLLDYDGTLADFKPTPLEAVPTPELLQILTRLTSDPKNAVVIVSGRPAETMEAWLGNLPLAFAAEHGFVVKELGHDWYTIQENGNAWKTEVAKAMQISAERLHGVIVEEKDNALAWHCRAVTDKASAHAEQQALIALLAPVAKQLGLRIIDGNDVVEVQPQGVDKGIAAQRWLDQGGWDFIMAAGDDTTDEDLFKAMPDGAFTLKVGPGETVAKSLVPTPTAMLAVLTALPV